MSGLIKDHMVANPYYFECSDFVPIKNPMVDEE